MLIIGITGTLGAGKGTIVDYLVNNKNFTHYSVRAFLIEKIKKLGLDENRDNMVFVANNLRKSYGSEHIVKQLYLKASQKGNNAIIESIRNTGEIEELKKLGKFILIAVDADPKIRYQRIISRKSETDNVNYDEFIENENREMHSSDPHSQNIFECIKNADFHLRNNGDFNNLYQQIETIFKSIEI